MCNYPPKTSYYKYDAYTNTDFGQKDENYYAPLTLNALEPHFTGSHHEEVNFKHQYFALKKKILIPYSIITWSPLISLYCSGS